MSDGYNLNPGRRRRITSSTKASSTIRLSRPVEVVVRTKEECIGNSELEGFRVRDSTPAAGECRSIIGNLYDGKAVEQTVAFVKEQEPAPCSGSPAYAWAATRKSEATRSCRRG
jgi:hypothetical protein